MLQLQGAEWAEQRLSPIEKQLGLDKPGSPSYHQVNEPFGHAQTRTFELSEPFAERLIDRGLRTGNELIRWRIIDIMLRNTNYQHNGDPTVAQGPKT